MQKTILASLARHLSVSEALHRSFAGPIELTAGRMIACLRSGGKILAMGNGGSAADAQHFACELVGRFLRERAALPVIALTTDTSILTAVSNDYSYADVFKRQVEAHARPGDVVFGISTSGSSENVLRGLMAARERGASTVLLGGGDGGRMKELADLALIVPSRETPRIQEAHITIIHILCEVVEAAMAGDEPR